MTALVLPDIIALAAVAARIDPAQLDAHTRLRNGLGLDSLALIDLAVAAEDRFGVRIPDDDLERFATLGDVAAFVAEGLPS